MIILCLMASWEMQKTERHCSECGVYFFTHTAAQSLWARKEVTCSAECARARKTRLQRERRGTVRP